MNAYIESLARRVLGDNPLPEFAAAIVDGAVSMVDMDDWVSRAIGGDVSPRGVWEAWARAGKPDYGPYLPFDYNDWGPDYRREQTANARVSAIADCVADALVTLVIELVIELVIDGEWEAAPCEEYDGQQGWFTDAGHLFGLEIQSGYLVPLLSE